jgi:hypothetical protein
MLTETQAIRAKNGQPEADDLSQGMSLLRVQLHTLEKSGLRQFHRSDESNVYTGGSAPTLRRIQA